MKISVLTNSVLLVGILSLGARAALDGESNAATPATAGGSSPDGIDLGQERSSDADIIILRSGDRLTGSIQNATFGIKTEYAVLTLRRPSLAAIELGPGPEDATVITTVNDSRFTGSFTDAVIVFQYGSKVLMQLEREKVARIVFRFRADELKSIPRRQRVSVKGGDHFTGRLLDKACQIVTSYGQVPVNLLGAESMIMDADDGRVARITMLNGDIIQGVPDIEKIAVTLDIDPTISIAIPVDRVEALNYRIEPGAADLDAGAVVAVRSAEEDYVFEVLTDSVLVHDVPESSQYHRRLEAGDRIVAVDGSPYQPGMLSPMRRELIDGKRSLITLTVARGDSKRFVRLMKGG